MIASSSTRVIDNTQPAVNDRIRRRTERSIARCLADGPAAIERRLHELDHEWDVERVLETLAPTFTLTGVLLGLTVRRRWFAVPLVINSFLIQHALDGWCPPLPILRRLGFRTTEEIDRERYALKALRGDFDSLPHDNDQCAVREAIAAVDL